MLQDEQYYFLQMISDFLACQESHKPINSLNWLKILEYARKHQVEAIIYHQCKKFIGESKLQESFARQSYAFVQRKNILKGIQHRFESCGIPYIVIKGTEVASLYPIPELRAMGDSDIYVHEEDKEQAHKTLVSLGFGVHSRNANEWVYSKNGIEIELHHRFLYDTDKVATTNLKEYADRLWQYTDENGLYPAHLDWNHHFIFILLHLRKHLMGEGVGFRQFMDIAVVSIFGNVNWEAIKADLECLGLLCFSKVCCTFCNRWFNISIHIGDDISDDFFERVTNKIFNDDVFGYDDINNAVNSSINGLRKSENKFLCRFRMLFRALFPSYQNMISTPCYSFMKGKKFLLPVAWIYRYYRTFHNGKYKKGLIAATVSFDNDKVQERENYMRDWGLI